MAKNGRTVTLSKWLQTGALRLARVHYFLVLALTAQIILYDASNVVTPAMVMWRWVAIAVLFAGVTAVWHLAHNINKSTDFYKNLIYFLITLDISLAAFSIYTQRGMASRAVFLFAIPIIVSAVLLNRVALFSTASLCIAVYVIASVTYFTLNFNEGYRAELYGEVGFYSAGFLVLAGLLSILIRFKNNDTS